SLRRDAEALERDFDMPIDILSKEDVSREMAADCYKGGLLFRAHGGVHPALLHQGLLDRARGRGVLVAGYTPDTGVNRDAKGTVVRTARGSVIATEVVATT